MHLTCVVVGRWISEKRHFHFQFQDTLKIHAEGTFTKITDKRC